MSLERLFRVRVDALYTPIGSVSNRQPMEARSPFSTPSGPIAISCPEPALRSLEPIARARDCETLASHETLHSTPSFLILYRMVARSALAKSHFPMAAKVEGAKGRRSGGSENRKM